MTPPYSTSPLLGPVPHGFFGREGGVSSGVYAALNVSEASDDDPANVATNRGRAVEALRFPFDALVTLRQVHSTTVAVLTGRPDPAMRLEADAVVTDRPGLLLGIQTADCAPVLLADLEAGVVAAAHAGWKGAAGGIVPATVTAMTRLGADPERVRAVIGPTISRVNYEVGPEFAARFFDEHPQAGDHFSIPAGGREHFDLPGFIRAQLAGAGLVLVEDTGLCTYADPSRWFSHRYATHRQSTTGRQISLIGLPG